MMITDDQTNSKVRWRKIKWTCLYLFIFAMIVRGIYYIGFRDNPFFDYVDQTFDQINFDKGAIGFADGDILARGGAEGYAPLYKYFLGIIYLVFGRNFHAIWAVQFTIGAISSVFMFLITTRLFNRWTGIICSIFYAGYSPNIFYEGNLIRASLTEFFAILLFYYLVRYKEETRLKYSILSATFLSLIIQCRPNTLCLLPFCLYFVYVIILKNKIIKDRIKHLLLFIAVIVIIGTPLMVRTVIIHQKFVLYDASGAQTILIGNVPEYEGVGWNNQANIDNVRKNVDANSNIKVISYILKRFWTSPIDYIRLYGRKIYWFFNNYEYPSNVNYYLYQEFSHALRNPLGNFSLLVSLAFVGIFLTCKNYKRYLLVYFFLIGLILSVIIVYPTSRFRMPIVPFFMIFASYAFYYIFQKIYQKKVILPIPCIVFVAFMVYLLKTPDSYSFKVRPIDYGNMASAYTMNENKYNLEKAEEYLIKSWNLNSKINLEREKNGLVLRQNKAAKELLALYTSRMLKNSHNKNYKEALYYAKKAVELDYSNEKTHSILSYCYFEQKDYLNATKEFKVCTMINQQNSDNYYNLFALYYSHLKDHLKAIKYFEKALDIKPDILKASHSNWNKLGKDLESVGLKIQQNIELNQDKIENLWNIALKAVESGEFELAISNCKEILTIDYGNINAHNYLAYSYRKLERYEESIAEYIDILSLNPYLASIHNNLYNLYANYKNDNVKAMYHLEQSLEIDPEQESHYELNKILYELKSWKELLMQIDHN